MFLSMCSFGPEAYEPDPNDTKILFIGNSLTFYWDMPIMFAQIADQSGKALFVDQWTFGGASLEDIYNYPETGSKIRQYAWDYVVLQGSSYHIAFPAEHAYIYPAIIGLKDLIVSNNRDTQILFFMDWAMKDSVIWNQQKYDYSDFQKMIRDGTLLVADSLNLKVAPVGWAWKQVVENRPDIELYEIDRGHPSLKGSYLQACVYYASIYLDSINVPYYRSIPQEEAEYLQNTANKTVLDSLETWNLLKQ
jgi:hypothetical protein